MNARLIALLLALLPGLLYAQMRPVGNGDVITQRAFAAKQIGRDLQFDETGVRVLTVMILENGDRRYTFPDGGSFAVTDRYHTRTFNRQIPIAKDRIFRMFPENKKLEPGMTWETSFRYDTGQYGLNEVKLTAKAEAGPEVTVRIDGKETKIPTALIVYRGPINSVNYSWRGKAEYTVVYSADLNEIVSSSGAWYDDKGFLMTGYKWALETVQTKQ